LGQKVHPVGFRLGVSKDWQAKWYADKHYTELIQEDLKIRKAISSKYATDDVSRVEIERAANQVTVAVYTARPGIVIGRGGQRVDEMRLVLERIAGKRVRLNIIEVARPEQDAYLVSRSIAQQLQRRISHRRAMKQAISRAMDSGVQGIKVTCSGRLTGSEYSRKETLYRGRVPLHTLRADIDYAQVVAHTTLGCTGIKVWIYKGDIIPESEKITIESPLVAPPVEREGIEGESKVEEEAKAKEEAPLEGEYKVEEEAKVEEKAEVEEAKVEEKPKAKTRTKTKTAPKANGEAKAEEEAKAKEEAQVEEAKVEEKPKAKTRPKTKTEPKANGEAKVGEEAKVEELKVEEKPKRTARPKTKGQAGTEEKPKSEMNEE
jgi:small subunit ribosomal protein S3